MAFTLVPLGLATGIAAGITWYRNLAVEVIIVPDKAAWRRGDRITGRVVIRNTTFEAVGLSRYSVLWVFPVNGRGERVRREHWLPLYSGISLGERQLEPVRGGPLEEPFEVLTDPLESRGHFMPPGRYTLTVEPTLEYPWNAPLRVHPAAVEILPEAVNGCGTRVVTFACGRGNLSVLRENGALESRELDTGKVLSSGKLDWDLPMETAPWGYRFSPDGSVLASVRRRDPLPDEPRLEIYRHSGNGFTGTLSLDLPEMKRSLHTLVRLIASSAEPGRYYLAYGGGILEVDEQVAESRIIAPSPEEAASGAIWFAVSPDGRFLVRYVDKGLEVLDRRSGQRRRVPVPGDRSELFGTRGFFIGSLAGEVVFRSYDGTEKRKLSTGAGRPLAESPGGRLVALATDREKPPVRVEIWEVDGARKICEWSEAGAFEPAFSGPPYRVLCATRVEGKSGASWISSEFRVHDAATGKVLQRLDLSADAGPAR